MPLNARSALAFAALFFLAGCHSGGLEVTRTIEFGEASGEAVVTQPLILTNQGGDDIGVFVQVTEGVGRFELSDTRVTVPAGGSTTIHVGYRPQPLDAGDFGTLQVLEIKKGAKGIPVGLHGTSVEPCGDASPEISLEGHSGSYLQGTLARVGARDAVVVVPGFPDSPTPQRWLLPATTTPVTSPVAGLEGYRLGGVGAVALSPTESVLVSGGLLGEVPHTLVFGIDSALNLEKRLDLPNLEGLVVAPGHKSGELAAMWREATGPVFGRFFGGALVEPPRVLGNGSELPGAWAIITTPTGYAVMLGGTFFALDADGKVLGTTVLENYVVMDGVRMAWSGRDIGLIWSDQPSSSLHFARVTSEGKVLTGPAVQLTDFTAHYFELRWTGTSWLTAFSTHADPPQARSAAARVYIQSIAADGTISGPAKVASCSTRREITSISLSVPPSGPATLLWTLFASKDGTQSAEVKVKTFPVP